jgi:hypothetical protein
MSIAAADAWNANVTQKLKDALATITIANGYKYDVAAVEEERKLLDINDRYDYILLIEDAPDIADDYMRVKNYVLWFFSAVNDEYGTGNSEVAYHYRNVYADIALCVHAHPTLWGTVEYAEAMPGAVAIFADSDVSYVAYKCKIQCITNIDIIDHYDRR